MYISIWAARNLRMKGEFRHLGGGRRSSGDMYTAARCYHLAAKLCQQHGTTLEEVTNLHLIYFVQA